MISLLIETSTERSLIALFRDLDPLDIRELPFGLQNSKHLLPEIKSLFERAGLKPADLDLIVAGIGPGSYTGIRVGAMTAKAMAFALNIPVIGISSLEGFIAPEAMPLSLTPRLAASTSDCPEAIRPFIPSTKLKNC